MNKRFCIILLIAIIITGALYWLKPWKWEKFRQLPIAHQEGDRAPASEAMDEIPDEEWYPLIEGYHPEGWAPHFFLASRWWPRNYASRWHP